jgi:hypothetical protein
MVNGGLIVLTLGVDHVGAIRAASARRAFFRGFRTGRFFRASATPTMTQRNNMLFSNMTLNPHALHICAHLRTIETEWADL